MSKLEIYNCGYVPCSCGCGQEAIHTIRGIFMPDKNPMTHYKRYKIKEEIHRQMQEKLNLGSMANG